MTAPLAWLLLSALALITPAQSHGPATWTGRAPALVAHPSQPVSGQTMTVLVVGLPRRAAHVDLTGTGLHVGMTRTGGGPRRATLQAPAAGPLSLGVRFTLHGRRYQAQVGVILVVPGSGVQ
jgi:hypothetical protein